MTINIKQSARLVTKNMQFLMIKKQKTSDPQKTSCLKLNLAPCHSSYIYKQNQMKNIEKLTYCTLSCVTYFIDKNEVTTKIILLIENKKLTSLYI